LESTADQPQAQAIKDTSTALSFLVIATGNEDFIRRNWEQKLQANDGQTQRILVNNPALGSELVTGKLGAISIPTLVVWGGDDLAEPLADGRDYAAKMPHAKLVIVQDCGHFPSLEKPGEFVAAVETFLH
jgi:pimeloyl-ACP methyl ester carboxylesterase